MRAALTLVALTLLVSGCGGGNVGGESSSSIASWLADEHYDRLQQRLNVRCIENDDEGRSYTCYGTIVAQPNDGATFTFDVNCDEDTCHYEEYRD